MMDDSLAPCSIQAPVAVTVRNSVDFARELRACCDEHRQIVLDLSELAEADLSFLQLVHAARVQLARAGGALRLASPAPDPIARLLVRAGFATEPDDVDFWFHGALPQ